jgi:hypothetical protein
MKMIRVNRPSKSLIHVSRSLIAVLDQFGPDQSDAERCRCQEIRCIDSIYSTWNEHFEFWSNLPKSIAL